MSLLHKNVTLVRNDKRFPNKELQLSDTNADLYLLDAFSDDQNSGNMIKVGDENTAVLNIDSDDNYIECVCGCKAYGLTSDKDSIIINPPYDTKYYFCIDCKNCYEINKI